MRRCILSHTSPGVLFWDIVELRALFLLQFLAIELWTRGFSLFTPKFERKRFEDWERRER
jgi:hypothetical protein